VPATSIGGNYQITWSAVSGATSYELEEDTVATFTSPTQVYNGSNTTHSFTNHGPGTFYYRVRARDAVGPSAWRVGANPCVVTVPPPPAPATITVPQTSPTGSYSIFWTASTGATSYDLQEANNSGFNGATLVYQGANLTYNVTGKVGGTWYYRVRATNAGGNSPYTVGANGCQIVPPNPPATITVPPTTASGNYSVTWATSQGATSYDLQEDTSVSFTNPSTIYSGANAQFSVTGKTSGTFYYRVRATNLVGSSTWTTDTTGCQVVPPAAPASITVPATSATGNYPVSWAAVTDATSYDLEEDANASFTTATTVYTGANTQFDVSGKVSGTFYYRVRAVGVAGAGPWMTDTTGCTIVPPDPPSSLTLPTQSTGVFPVDWTASSGATTYDLEEDLSPGFTNPVQVYSGANLSFNAVQSAGTWYYRVRAVNAAGASGWTTGLNGCVIIPPGAPTPLTVPATSATGAYAVTWGSSPGATHYELQESLSSAFTGARTLCNGANLNFMVMGRTNGTYYYRVRASNGAGSSPWTVDATGCTVNLMPPADPASLTVPSASSTGNYVVSWTPVPGAWTYELEEALSPSFTLATQVYAGVGTSTSLAGRVNGTYYYRVRGLNAAGQSGWTNGSNGCTVTLAAPSPPGFLNVPATSSTGNYSLDWGLSSGATLYEVEESPDGGFTSTVQVYFGANATFTVTGRSNGTYHYRVRAVNAVGMSGWTNGPNGCTVTVTQASLHVEAGRGNPVPTTEMPGALGVRVLHLLFTAGMGEGIILQSLRVNGTGTGDEGTEISTVRLIRDVNGDGIVDGGDVEVGTGTYSGDEGTVDFDLSGEAPMSAGDSRGFIVSYDFSTFALSGSTFSCTVTLPGDLQCAGMMSLTGVPSTGGTVSGGVKTVAASGAGSLALSVGTNSPAPGQVATPATGVAMLQIYLTASSMEGVQVSRIQFCSGGTGDESSGVTARLFDDMNGDGQVSTGDLELRSMAFTSDNGILSFTGLSLVVPPGQTLRLLLAYDLSGSTVSGTYGTYVAVDQDVEAVGQLSGMGIIPSGAPLVGGMQMMVPGSDEGGATGFMGGCAGGPGVPADWAGWLLIAAMGFWALKRRRKA
jgi:predicted phage tail protein